MGILSRKTENYGPRRTPRAGAKLEPAMSPEEQSQLCAIIASRRPRTMVEWGSGGSTIVVPGNFSFIETYVSVEHNAQWHEKVKSASEDPRVVHVLAPPADHAPEPPMFKQGKGKTLPEYVAWSDRCEREPDIMQAYVDSPFQHVEHPDLFLVDGRARRFCIERAWAALKPGGVMVVHDAQRDEYIEKIDEVCGDHAHWMVPWSRGQICVAGKA
jgi:hypothetical protein